MACRRDLVAAGFALGMLVAACGPMPATPTAVSPGAVPSPVLRGSAGTLRPPTESPSGAATQVVLDGGTGCDAGFVCTARFSVLPGGTDLASKRDWQPASTDPYWQMAGDGVLDAPPDGDLPRLALGSHLLVWSVSVRMIVTDSPEAPPPYSPRCASPVAVAAGESLVTVRIRFPKAGSGGSGTSRCTLIAVTSGATPAPTAASISGSADIPAAALPTAWRRVGTPDLSGLVALSSPIVLGVAPDGAFIGILSSADRRGALVLRSVDGETWVVAGRLPDSAGASIRAIAGNGRFIVAAGWGSTTAQPALWTSPDGMAWTRLATADADGLTSSDVLAANSAGFVASGSSLGVAPWVSSDPSSAWHHVGSVTANPDGAISGVAPSGKGFVAVGFADRHPMPAAASGLTTADAGVWLSDDGRAWTRTSVAGGSGVQLWAVAAQGSRLVALGNADWPREVAVFISADGGHSWSPVTGRGPDSACCGVVAVANGFLATTFTVWASSDGASWDDSGWTAAVGPATNDIRSLRVAVSGARVVAAATYDSSSPAFFIGSAP